MLQRISRVGALAALAIAAVAAAASAASYVMQESQVLSTTTTPASATAGFSLAGVAAFQVELAPPSGERLTGGTLRAWYRTCPTKTAGGSAVPAAWHRNPELDLVVPDLTSEDVDTPHAWPQQQVLVPCGRAYYQADVTTSGGADVDVRVLAWRGK